jgi:hypothetical protein
MCFSLLFLVTLVQLLLQIAEATLRLVLQLLLTLHILAIGCSISRVPAEYIVCLCLRMHPCQVVSVLLGWPHCPVVATSPSPGPSASAPYSCTTADPKPRQPSPAAHPAPLTFSRHICLPAAPAPHPFNAETTQPCPTPPPSPSPGTSASVP